jgi:hypothetical protein
MRFVTVAVTFVLALAFLPGMGLPAPLDVRPRPASVQGAKKPAKK